MTPLDEFISYVVAMLILAAILAVFFGDGGEG